MQFTNPALDQTHLHACHLFRDRQISHRHLPRPSTLFDPFMRERERILERRLPTRIRLRSPHRRRILIHPPLCLSAEAGPRSHLYGLTSAPASLAPVPAPPAFPQPQQKPPTRPQEISACLTSPDPDSAPYPLTRHASFFRTDFLFDRKLICKILLNSRNDSCQSVEISPRGDQKCHSEDTVSSQASRNPRLCGNSSSSPATPSSMDRRTDCVCAPAKSRCATANINAVSTK